MRWRAWVLTGGWLLGGCFGQQVTAEIAAQAPSPTHAMVRGGRTLALLAWVPSKQGGTLHTTTAVRIGGHTHWARSRAVATTDSQGSLRRWTREGPRCADSTVCRSSTLTVEVDGHQVHWSQQGEDDGRARREGTLTPAGPLAWPWLPSTLHQGRVLLDATASGPLAMTVDKTPYGSELHAAGQTWHLDEAGVRRAELPWGIRIVPVAEARPLEPSEPVTALQVLTTPIPQPATARRLRVQADDGRTVTIERTLPAEIAPRATQAPTLKSSWWHDPLPTRPSPARTLDALREVHAVLSDKVTQHTVFGPPHGVVTLTRGTGDCDDLADAAVLLLQQRGVAARRVSGWLYTEQPVPRFVRHAWIEVWSGPQPGWFASDPGLGQLLADVTHIADTIWDPAGPPQHFEVVDVR